MNLSSSASLTRAEPYSYAAEVCSVGEGEKWRGRGGGKGGEEDEGIEGRRGGWGK